MMSGRKDFERPSLREYLAIVLVIAAGVVLVRWATTLAPTPAEPREIAIPMTAMFALTGAVWLLMVISRNAAVLLGAASVKYFRDFGDGAPDEWIERPARAFDNLMEAPTLFYIVALLTIALHSVDASQVSLAWVYVASRAVHATIYIVFNYVPLRFASYAVSCITLAAMWVRVATSL